MQRKRKEKTFLEGDRNDAGCIQENVVLRS